ncbi:hypothetical protein JE959_000117 [Aeromonas veronii]|nr:hypothetical protein [Aeromonas veronii]
MMKVTSGFVATMTLLCLSGGATALPLDLQWGQRFAEIDKTWPLTEVNVEGGYLIDKTKIDQKKPMAFDRYYLQILPENGLCSMMVSKKVTASYSAKGLIESYDSFRKILGKEFGRSVPLGMKDEEIVKMSDELLLSIRAGKVKIKEGWSRNVRSHMSGGIRAVYLSIDEVDPFRSEAIFSIGFDGNTEGCLSEIKNIREGVESSGSRILISN